MTKGTGFLAGANTVAKNSVLATARATGRAAALCHDSVLAAYKGAAFVATRTSDLLASSGRLLNPFRRRARSAGPAKSRGAAESRIRSAARIGKRSGRLGPPLEERESERETMAHKEAEEVGRRRRQPASRPRAAAGTPAGEILPGERGVKGTEATDGENDRRAVQGRKERGKSRKKRKVGVLPAREEGEPAPAEPAIQSHAEVDAKTEARESSPQLPGAEGPPSLNLTVKRTCGVPFAGAAERVVFDRALADMASPDAATRAVAAEAMGRIHHEVSVKALAAHLARETFAEVRKECVNALTALEMEEGLPMIEEALTDPAASVRLAAVWGLYRLAGPEGAAALTRMFRDEDEDVRRRAATCAGWLGQESLAVDLLPLLADESIPVRRAAAVALGTLRSRQVVPALIERLDDPDQSVRKAALDSLEAITGRRVNDKLLADRERRQRLIARWREWEKEESPRQGAS